MTRMHICRKAQGPDKCISNLYKERVKGLGTLLANKQINNARQKLRCDDTFGSIARALYLNVAPCWLGAHKCNHPWFSFEIYFNPYGLKINKQHNRWRKNINNGLLKRVKTNMLNRSIKIKKDIDASFCSFSYCFRNPYRSLARLSNNSRKTNIKVIMWWSNPNS